MLKLTRYSWIFREYSIRYTVRLIALSVIVIADIHVPHWTGGGNSEEYYE
jgi:hypothetical protein